MDVRLMRYFLAIAQEGNLTKAANRLHISQPSLSKQMKELEEELGRTLFMRGNRNITLTDDGMYFRKRAQEIVDLTDKLLVDLDMEDMDVAGDIHIGCAETTEMDCLAAIMKEMKEEYPQVMFHIHSGNAVDIQERIEKGLYDMGLFVGLPKSTRMEMYPLHESIEWGVVMPRDDELASRPYITKEDLKGKPLIVSEQALINGELGEWVEDKRQVCATYNLFFNAGFMVSRGMGYALTIEGIYGAHENLVFIPLEPSFRLPLFLGWKKYQAFSKASLKFIELVKRCHEN